ncbi:MAG: hypothetical protein ABJD68_10755 [Nakamurella sp.]
MTESDGNSGRVDLVFRRRAAGPLLLPAFIWSALLLFTHAFSAYATAAALITQHNTGAHACVQTRLDDGTVVVAQMPAAVDAGPAGERRMSPWHPMGDRHHNGATVGR